MIKHHHTSSTSEIIFDALQIGTKVCTIHATTLRSDNKIIHQTTKKHALFTSIDFLLIDEWDLESDPVPHLAAASCVNLTHVTVWKDGKIACTGSPTQDPIQAMTFLQSNVKYNPLLFLGTCHCLTVRRWSEEKDTTKTKSSSSSSGFLGNPTASIQVGKSIQCCEAAPRGLLLVAFSDGSSSVYNTSLIELVCLSSIVDSTPAPRIPAVACRWSGELVASSLYLCTALADGRIDVWSASSLFRVVSEVVVGQVDHIYIFVVFFFPAADVVSLSKLTLHHLPAPSTLIHIYFFHHASFVNSMIS